MRGASDNEAILQCTIKGDEKSFCSVQRRTGQRDGNAPEKPCDCGSEVKHRRFTKRLGPINISVVGSIQSKFRLIYKRFLFNPESGCLMVLSTSFGSIFIHLKRRNKGLLRNLDLTELTHFLFTRLLLIQ